MPSDKTRHRGIRVGQRIRSSSIPNVGKSNQSALSADGLLLRGVVVATYVQLEEADEGSSITQAQQRAVYCDVLIYSAVEGVRNALLRRCLVTQPLGTNLHEGHVWRPRAAQIDITQDYSAATADPGNLDGDHVLVGFMDNSYGSPVILRGVPPPNYDTGNEELDQAGHRMRLKAVDGDPNLWKHHGTFYGIDKNGAFIIDSTRAHDGNYGADGSEIPQPNPDDFGDVQVRLPATREFTIRGLSVDGQNEAFTMRLKSDEILLDVQDDGTAIISIGGDTNLVLTGNDAAATLTLGDGAVHAAIAEHMQALWEQLEIYLSTHTHSAGLLVAPSGAVTGTTGTPAPPGPATPPEWDAGINSTKVSFPDG